MNHNQPLTPTNKDWYNAGIMAQRILQNDEIDLLKKRLKTGTEGHEKLVEHFNRQEIEIEELKNQNLALQDRIRIMQEQLSIASEQVPKGAFEFNHLKK